MAYTVPLKPLPTAHPNSQAPIVDKDGKPTPEFFRLLNQRRAWEVAADAALREVEP